MTDQLWPADAVQRRSLDALVPYARNSRTHSPEQVAQIAASMREYGFTTPILIDEHGNIIAGHGRVMAAQMLVRSGSPEFEEVPVMEATGWSDSKKRAYVIADNKLALNAGWDNEALALEIQELMSDGYDIGLTGFSDAEIERLLPSEVHDIDANDFMPEDTGETSSGTANNALKFGNKVVPMSEDEIDRLTDFLDRYVADRGVNYGFVGALLDAATVGHF